MTTNPELELAYEYIAETGRHVFLTGKAGTGKTTFLHRIKAEVPKRMAVVAPTGVAAINAKGVTIHSLFQLPFGVILPDGTQESRQQRAFSAKKINLIKSLDLLVIDEISMVRADILDAIDVVLRRYRYGDRPFGGLQLLMIGDLHQLPPVVKPEDWRQLAEYYKTPYFFGSIALRKAVPAVIQLKHIYRQSDEIFISLLNKVRNNQLDERVLATLNQRYDPDFSPEKKDGYITLTSHNNSARKINDEKLASLKSQEHIFTAEIGGTFPESMYPNTPTLAFKTGAQVMFNRNDNYPDRLYYNGKIGTITGIEKELITVTCPGEPPIEVLPITWENRKFVLNEKTNEVEENVVGTYEQHPLKLAWAITIHKSQGLTFEKVIIDAQAAFAHGQVYVALSRCKSFEGIVLRTPIDLSSVRTDAVVKNYSSVAEENQPTPQELQADKKEYQANCLRDLFGFNLVERAAMWLRRSLLEHERSFQAGVMDQFNPVLRQTEEKLVNIANRFLPRLEVYFRDPGLPVQHAELNERLAGAAKYFITELEKKVLPAVNEFPILTDNQAVKKQAEERRQKLELLLFVKLQLFKSVQAGFDPKAYAKARSGAEVEFSKRGKDKKKRTKAPQNIVNRELYLQLVTWRSRVVDALQIPPSAVVDMKTILEIAQVLPTTKASLLRIKGFGKKRFDEYGKEIVAIVEKYIAEHNLPSDQLAFASKAPPKPDTKTISLTLYKSGKSMPEIAKERSLTEGTIFRHLSHWVQEGIIPIHELIDQEKIDTLLPYWEANPEAGSKDAYDFFGQRFSYDELRLVKSLAEE